MYKKKLLKKIIFFLLAPIFSFGQIFTDSDSHSLLTNVKIFSKNGTIVGTSKENKFYKITSAKINPDSDYEVFLANYKPIKIKGNLINSKNVISLERNTIEIPEVIINKPTFGYIVLRGYYSTYKTINEVPTSFSDGIIEYYIPSDGNSNIKSKIIKNRYFVNKKYIESISLKNKLSQMQPDSDALPFNFVEEILHNKEIENLKADEVSHNLYKGNIKFGFYNHNGENLEINMIYNTPENTITKKIFGFTSKIINYYQTENFVNSENIKNLKLSNLRSISRLYNSVISNKVNNEVNYLLFEQFNIENVSFINKVEYSNLRKELFSQNQQKYDNIPLFTPTLPSHTVPQFISDLLDKDLEKK